jgi:hypothetical protein
VRGCHECTGVEVVHACNTAVTRRKFDAMCDLSDAALAWATNPPATGPPVG